MDPPAAPRPKNNILWEILVLLVYCCYTTFEAIYKLLVSSPRSKNLKGEIALITGAGHGIGRELALQLAQKDGVKIVCWDINDKSAEETALEISKNGGTAWAFKCDVSNRDQVAKVAKMTRYTPKLKKKIKLN
jgi:all-trans-retinol dehydrogenase (NAD+)